MALFGLELRDWEGGPVEPLQAVLVVLLFYVTVSLTAWLVLVVVLLNERGRGLHDILAGTVMVRRQDRPQAASAAAPPARHGAPGSQTGWADPQRPRRVTP